MRVMEFESGGIVNRHNYNPATGDDSWGCFQVNRWGGMAQTRPAAEWLINPENNVKYAIGIYQRSGFCSTASWYNTSKKLGLCK